MTRTREPARHVIESRLYISAHMYTVHSSLYIHSSSCKQCSHSCGEGRRESSSALEPQSLWVILHLHFKQTLWLRVAWLREPKAVAVSDTLACAYTGIWCSIGHENHMSTINKACNPRMPNNGSCWWGFYKRRRVTGVCNLRWISRNAACRVFTRLIVLKCDSKETIACLCLCYILAS